MFYYKYNTKIGEIYIAEEDEHIVKVSFSKIEAKEKKTGLIKLAYSQLCEYFDGKRKIFELPLNLIGTEFQQKVWKALKKIPYGSTCTYKDVAFKIGNPKASRAVGMANNKNPIAIIIPCHRVIGKNGTLTGYAGGLKIKEELLKLEADYIKLY